MLRAIRPSAYHLALFLRLAKVTRNNVVHGAVAPIIQSKNNKMKKLFAMSLLLLSTLGLHAQSFGVKGGFGYSTLNGAKIDGVDMKGRGGFYIGALAELPVTSYLALQPEVLYSQQGASWEVTRLGQTLSLRLKTSYINIPVMAKLRVGNLSFMAGPQLGFLVGTPSQELALGGNSVKLSRDSFASIDFGIGLGAEFLITKGLFIDLRYTHGLINTLDKENSTLRKLQISDKNSFKNATFTLGLGLKI